MSESKWMSALICTVLALQLSCSNTALSESSSAGFSVGVRVVPKDSEQAKMKKRKSGRHTVRSAAITLRKLGYNDITLQAVEKDDYWFLVTGTAGKRRVLVSSSHGEIIQTEQDGLY
jgi:hypothetical protein